MILFECAKCKKEYQIGDIGDASIDTIKCHGCGKKNKIVIYDAILKELNQGEKICTITEEDDANCYKHQKNLAVKACDHCGAYICSLCDIEIHGEHICPDCFNNQQKSQSNSKSNFMHAQLAFILSIAQVFIWYLIPIFSIGIIIYSIIFWKKDKNPYGKSSKIFFILAILISLIALIGFSILLIEIISSRGSIYE